MITLLLLVLLGVQSCGGPLISGDRITDSAGLDTSYIDNVDRITDSAGLDTSYIDNMRMVFDG